MKVKIYTRTCIMCGEEGMVVIDATDDQLDRFEAGQGNIQSVFPHVPKEVREQIISGVHPKCWDEMPKEL